MDAVAWTNEHQAMAYLIDEYCDSLVLTHSPSTVRDRRRLLWQLHRDLPHGIVHGTDDQIRAWLARPGWSENTRHTYGAHIIEAYRWLSLHGWILDNPCARIKTPPAQKGRPRPIREDYLALLLAQPEPLPTIALLGAYEGLRRAEMAGCRREHITEDEVLIVRAKGGHTQTVPTHPLVWAHVEHRGLGPLLLNAHGRQMTPNRLSGIWRRARERLGLPETLVPHQLRHRFGTEVRREHDVLVAKRALRHSSLTSTEIYTDVGSEEVAQAIRSLPLVTGYGPDCGRPVPPQAA